MLEISSGFHPDIICKIEDTYHMYVSPPQVIRNGKPDRLEIAQFLSLAAAGPFFIIKIGRHEIFKELPWVILNLNPC
jgi:hypothetical protein